MVALVRARSIEGKVLQQYSFSHGAWSWSTGDVRIPSPHFATASKRRHERQCEPPRVGQNKRNLAVLVWHAEGAFDERPVARPSRVDALLGCRCVSANCRRIGCCLVLLSQESMSCCSREEFSRDPCSPALRHLVPLRHAFVPERRPSPWSPLCMDALHSVCAQHLLLAPSDF